MILLTFFDILDKNIDKIISSFLYSKAMYKESTFQDIRSMIENIVGPEIETLNEIADFEYGRLYIKNNYYQKAKNEYMNNKKKFSKLTMIYTIILEALGIFSNDEDDENYDFLDSLS